MDAVENEMCGGSEGCEPPLTPAPGGVTTLPKIRAEIWPTVRTRRTLMPPLHPELVWLCLKRYWTISQVL